MHRLTCAFVCLILVACGGPSAEEASQPGAVAESQPLAAVEDAVTWRFDSLEQIGGHPIEVLGDPEVVDTTSLGKVMEFDGDDAVIVPVHPLAGAQTFTWEVVFRPDSGGAAEQRFFHLQQDGADTRMLFETRLVENGWYLDAYVNSGGSVALAVPENVYPLDQWYHVAQVYDGKTYSSYVDGELQASQEVELQPEGEGKTSVGVRINLVDYFKGAVQMARFTKRALSPDEFLPPL